MCQIKEKVGSSAVQYLEKLNPECNITEDQLKIILVSILTDRPTKTNAALHDLFGTRLSCDMIFV